MDVATGTTRENGSGITEPLKKQATADGLWHFCLHHSSNPEVQQACIALQEEFGGNINLVMFLAWIEHAGYSLDLEAVMNLKSFIHESDGLIRRYRLMRRDLKSQLQSASYNKTLNFEISLEKFQQYEIIRCANDQAWTKTASSSVMLYCELLDRKARALYPYLMKGLRGFETDE